VKDALIGINQLIDEDANKTAEPPPVTAEPITRQFLRIFDGKSELARDQILKIQQEQATVITESVEIDPKFHKFLDDTPLPIPFGHPDGKVQSIPMIPWRKGARPITHLDTFLFNRLNRSIRFMPLAIEHDASIAAPQAKHPRSMVRFGFAEP
jgi:hypothetical protein